MNRDEQLKMFGTTLSAVCNLFPHSNLADPFEAIRASQSLQSDAQEMIERGDLERARQTLNLSKYILDNVVGDLR